MRSWAIVSASVAVLAPVVTWTVAARLQPPGYSAVRQTVSALAAHGATDRWVMTLGLSLLGLAHLVTAIGLTEVKRPARVILALGGLAVMVVATRPQPDSGHIPAATIGFIALALWSVTAKVIPGATRILAVGILAGLTIWFATQFGGGALLGLTERILILAEALWPLIVAVRIRAAARAR